MSEFVEARCPHNLFITTYKSINKLMIQVHTTTQHSLLMVGGAYRSEPASRTHDRPWRRDCRHPGSQPARSAEHQ